MSARAYNPADMARQVTVGWKNWKAPATPAPGAWRWHQNDKGNWVTVIRGRTVTVYKTQKGNQYRVIAVGSDGKWASVLGSYPDVEVAKRAAFRFFGSPTSCDSTTGGLTVERITAPPEQEPTVRRNTRKVIL